MSDLEADQSDTPSMPVPLQAFPSSLGAGEPPESPPELRGLEAARTDPKGHMTLREKQPGMSLIGLSATMNMQFFGGSTVFVIDGNATLRAALKKLLESIGHQVELFASGEAFLQRAFRDTPGCIVLDARLPGVSGLKLQEELAKANIRLPLVFLTEYGDIPMAVRAIKAGAVDFLTKPFREQDLLDAIATALEQDRRRRSDELRNATLRERFDSLSGRERDIVARVTAGALNKQIAADLGLSEVTVKVYRANAMRKLRVKSLAELVRMTETLRSIDVLDPKSESSCRSRNTDFPTLKTLKGVATTCAC